ncbi:hypothetical protein [Streptomyces sp. 303MFCol5.2]|uniref:hypothetical protein n=1 Tax=Streptomyces sp. 303MFCol5.2 TaxID=1172181 RepID=UPI00131F1EC1|nr:hypothetical protein [Streptomyces sp. 303MFCol5.2]
MATRMPAGDLHQAQDLVNDAFVKPFRAGDTIDNPKHRLIEVIARDAITSRRQWKGRLADPARIHVAERSRPVPDPAALTEQREDYHRVLRALSAPSDRRGTISVLRRRGDWVTDTLLVRQFHPVIADGAFLAEPASAPTPSRSTRPQGRA